MLKISGKHIHKKVCDSGHQERVVDLFSEHIGLY